MTTAKGPSHIPPAPARIWALMAGEAPLIVIFRRAPSWWTRLYLWETETDTITPGSWFKGRLYEWESDLSPDGRHLLYLARNESPRQLQDSLAKFGEPHELRAWTALCTPPWVRAWGLWNSNIERGGGVFTANRTVIVNTSQHWKALVELQGFQVQFREHWEDPLLTSLQRTGWGVIHW